jgi:hypothetical protein
VSKSRRTIALEDVDRIFDADCIKALAKLSKLPEGADIEKFGERIKEDARIYARDAGEPSNNELHDEIKALHDASEKKVFERVAYLIEHLSPRARSELVGRSKRRTPGAGFPQSNDLRVIDQREAVCATIASLCRMGGSYVEGRMRPSGKRSRTWQWLYYAPELRRHFPKRSAERDFVMHLAITWCEITGKRPPKFVYQQGPGPFARMVQKCFTLSGSAANAVNLINRLGRQRND